jgi:hypothetical protein
MYWNCRLKFRIQIGTFGFRHCTHKQIGTLVKAFGNVDDWRVVKGSCISGNASGDISGDVCTRSQYLYRTGGGSLGGGFSFFGGGAKLSKWANSNLRLLLHPGGSGGGIGGGGTSLPFSRTQSADPGGGGCRRGRINRIVVVIGAHVFCVVLAVAGSGRLGIVGRLGVFVVGRLGVFVVWILALSISAGASSAANEFAVLRARSTSSNWRPERNRQFPVPDSGFGARPEE